MSKVGAYRPFGLGHDDLYELADIRVSTKEVERVSQIVGGQVEAFHAVEAKAALSDRPIQPFPRMYVLCMGWRGHAKSVCWGTVLRGYGTSLTNIFMGQLRLLIYTMRENITGMLPGRVLGRTPPNCMRGRMTVTESWMRAR
jgi:hypothetical protein